MSSEELKYNSKAEEEFNISIENEIWNEFSELSGYDFNSRMSYGKAKSHFGIDYEKPISRVDSIGGNQYIQKDADKKIDEALLNGGKINWDEIAKLYPKSTINFNYNVLKSQYPPPKFRTHQERRDIAESILVDWNKRKESLYLIFPNEEKASEYLISKRWGLSISCPRCNSEKIYISNDKKQSFICANPKCHLHFSEKVGTIFQDSKLPLIKWYEGIYLLTSTKTAKLSTPQLSKALDVTQKTAWHIMAKIKSKIKEDFISNIKNGLFKHEERSLLSELIDTKRTQLELNKLIKQKQYGKE